MNTIPVGSVSKIEYCDSVVRERLEMLGRIQAYVAILIKLIGDVEGQISILKSKIRDAADETRVSYVYSCALSTAECRLEAFRQKLANAKAYAAEVEVQRAVAEAMSFVEGQELALEVSVRLEVNNSFADGSRTNEDCYKIMDDLDERASHFAGVAANNEVYF